MKINRTYNISTERLSAVTFCVLVLISIFTTQNQKVTAQADSSSDGLECNCVLWLRENRVPKLPRGLDTLVGKKKIINSTEPKVGSVAIMDIFGDVGHVAYVTEVSSDGTITVEEANYKRCQITSGRKGKPTDKGFKVVGYFEPPSKTVPSPTPNPTPHSFDITVQASQMWMDTGIDMTNKRISIKYVGGKWSNGGDNPIFSDAAGSGSWSGLLVPNAPFRSLVGKTERGTFRVGNYFEGYAGRGRLFLSINDTTDFADNIGSIKVVITILESGSADGEDALLDRLPANLDFTDTSTLATLKNYGLIIVCNPRPAYTEEVKEMRTTSKNNGIDVRSEKILPIVLKASGRCENGKPNPLSLVVEITSGGGLALNNENQGNVLVQNALLGILNKIFRERRENGVYREETNNIENTVTIQVPPRINKDIFVRTLKLVSGSGSSPIALYVGK